MLALRSDSELSDLIFYVWANQTQVYVIASLAAILVYSARACGTLALHYGAYSLRILVLNMDREVSTVSYAYALLYLSRIYQSRSDTSG